MNICEYTKFVFPNIFNIFLLGLESGLYCIFSGIFYFCTIFGGTSVFPTDAWAAPQGQEPGEPKPEPPRSHPRPLSDPKKKRRRRHSLRLKSDLMSAKAKINFVIPNFLQKYAHGPTVFEPSQICKPIWTKNSNKSNHSLASNTVHPNGIVIDNTQKQYYIYFLWSAAGGGATGDRRLNPQRRPSHRRRDPRPAHPRRAPGWGVPKKVEILIFFIPKSRSIFPPALVALMTPPNLSAHPINAWVKPPPPGPMLH